MLTWPKAKVQPTRDALDRAEGLAGSGHLAAGDGPHWASSLDTIICVHGKRAMMAVASPVAAAIGPTGLLQEDSG